MNNILKMINKICLIIITLSLLLLSFGCKDNNEEVIEKSSQYKLYECAKESGYEGDYNDFISSVRGEINPIDLVLFHTKLYWRKNGSKELHFIYDFWSLVDGEPVTYERNIVNITTQANVATFCFSVAGDMVIVKEKINNPIDEGQIQKIYFYQRYYEDINIPKIVFPDGKVVSVYVINVEKNVENKTVSYVHNGDLYEQQIGVDENGNEYEPEITQGYSFFPGFIPSPTNKTVVNYCVRNNRSYEEIVSDFKNDYYNEFNEELIFENSNIDHLTVNLIYFFSNHHEWLWLLDYFASVRPNIQNILYAYKFYFSIFSSSWSEAFKIVVAELMSFIDNQTYSIQYATNRPFRDSFMYDRLTANVYNEVTYLNDIINTYSARSYDNDILSLSFKPYDSKTICVDKVDNENVDDYIILDNNSEQIKEFFEEREFTGWADINGFDVNSIEASKEVYLYLK